MPKRIVPSQVVKVIERLYKDPKKFKENFGHGEMYRIATIAELADAVPQELIIVGEEEYAKFVFGVEAIKTAIDHWNGRGDFPLGPESAYGLNPVGLIYEVLRKCPDEFPTSSPDELSFIDDPEFRDALLLDLSNTDRHLSNGEWKSATVLAGSVCEA